MRFYINSMISEFTEKHTGYPDALIGNFNLLSVHLSRNYYHQQENNHLSSSVINIHDILNYIKKHYASATIESITRHFNYHPTYIPQMLKKHTGKTFIELLQQARITVAKQELIETEMSIQEIAYDIGYKNQSHFYRLFKRHTGISPAEFRYINRKFSL